MNSKMIVAFIALSLLASSMIEASFDANTQIRLCGMKLIRFLEHTCDHKYVRKPKAPVQGGLAYQCCTNKCSLNFLKGFCQEPEKARNDPPSFLRH
uniref:IlGF domain-containing protein n=1 Tax=Steinernema glaseri TaxID=37863 RepID=A0A1I7Z9T8_9BILA